MNHYLTLIQRRWPLLLFGFLCVFWGNFGQSFLLGWFSEAIKTQLDISAQQYGALYSFATLASALAVMWIGGRIDVWSLQRFTAFAVLGLLAAALVMFSASQYWLVAAGFFLLRLFGQGLLPHTGLTAMAKYFEADRGKAISIASTGVSFGEVVLPLAVVALITHSGWQGVWLWVALSSVLFMLPLLLWLLHKATTNGDVDSIKSAQNQPARSGRSVLFTDRRYWLAAPTLLSLPFVLTAIFIHQDFILQEKSWSLALMAKGFILYGVSHWLSSLIFGSLVDRFGATALLRVYNLPLIVGLLITANCTGPWVALCMLLLFGIAIGASGPVVGALWAEAYGTDIIGGVRSAAASIIVLSTAVSPILFGWLIDHQISLRGLLNCMAIVLVLGWALLFASYRRGQPAVKA